MSRSDIDKIDKKLDKYRGYIQGEFFDLSEKTYNESYLN